MCLRLVVLLVCLLWVSPRCPEQDADKFVGQPTASIQVPGFLFFYFICADNLVTLFLKLAPKSISAVHSSF
jgi:hypothetical protein